MTAADKRKTIAAIRKVARWMSDPRHRVKDWTRMYEPAQGPICRTCIAGAFYFVAHTSLPNIVETTAQLLRPIDSFTAPWTTAELRKLFRESIKAVEESA